MTTAEKINREREKINSQRERLYKRIEKRAIKEDSVYLNSTSRFVTAILKSILEFLLVFVLVSLLVDFLEKGSIDFQTLPDTVLKYLAPGNVIFDAMVTFLPVMAVSVIKSYFGLGTYPRMLLGIAKFLILIWWVHNFAVSVGTLDLVEAAGISGSSALQGVQSISINVQPMEKLIDVILLLCCLIPIGEFLGARRKHNDAYIRHLDRKAAKEEEAAEEDKEAEEESSDADAEDEKAEVEDEKTESEDEKTEAEESSSKEEPEKEPKEEPEKEPEEGKKKEPEEGKKKRKDRKKGKEEPEEKKPRKLIPDDEL